MAQGQTFLVPTALLMDGIWAAAKAKYALAGECPKLDMHLMLSKVWMAKGCDRKCLIDKDVLQWADRCTQTI